MVLENCISVRVLLVPLLFLANSSFGQNGSRQLSNAEQVSVAEARRLEDASTQRFQEGSYDEACELAKKVLGIYESIYGPEHREVSTSLVNLAHMYNYKGQYDEAEKLLVRAIKIDEKIFGPNDKNSAVTLNNLGELYLKQGKFDAAEPLLLRSLRNMESNYGTDHPNVAVALSNLAAAMELQGNYRNAEPLIKRALMIREQAFGTEHIDTGNCLKQLAGLYQSTGDFAAAEQTYLRAKATIERAVGANHPTLASILNNLAGLYVDLGNYAAAKPLFERSLRINEDSLGAQHPTTATTVCNLATLYLSELDYNKAETLYRRAYESFGQELGEEHPRTAACAQLLGATKARQNDFESAERFFLRAMKSFESSLGPEHLEIGHVTSDLGVLKVRVGDLKNAEPLLRRSIAIAEKTLPADHPFTVSCFLNLATLKQKTNEASEADVFFDRGQKAGRRYNAGILPSLSENEQAKYIEERFTTAFFAALSFGVANTNDRSIESHSASWLINGKAVGLETLAQRNLLSRDTADPKLASVAQQLQQVRGQLSSLAVTTSDPEQAGAKKDFFDKLVDREQRLSKQLSAARGSLENGYWIDVNKIYETLSQNTAFIDFARFDAYDFSAIGGEKTWKAARYGAWITRGGDKGETVLVDLGNADEIDSLLKNVCASIPKGISQVIANGEAEATRVATKKLALLADKIWKPLESELVKFSDKTDSLILSPDGALWLVPWACLPVSSDASRVLLENYSIRFVTSGRDLVAKPRISATKAPIILANPQFDQTAIEKRTAIESVYRGALPVNDVTGRNFAARSLLPKVSSLPGTGVEATVVAPSIKAWAGQEPMLFPRQFALERVAKAMRHPKLVCIATHGFFLPAQEVDRNSLDSFGVDKSRSVAIDVRGTPIENPLLRCGLLFSGCNSQDSAVGDDDGILTGLEIIGIDLRGTELVVLSACETGIGDVRNGEGIAGLRQAFQLAGAQSVVSSLWQVPDHESSQIMIDFYANLAAGQTRAASLRNAQLKMIASRREFFGAAHPYYWAAWTLTGQDR